MDYMDEGLMAAMQQEQKSEDTRSQPRYYPRPKPDYCTEDGNCAACKLNNATGYDCRGHRLLTMLERAVEIVYQTGRYPIFCGCWYCGGTTGISEYGSWKDIQLTKEEATTLAVMQHGHFLDMWHADTHSVVLNATIIPRVCSCDCDHEWKEVSWRDHWRVATCAKCGKSAGHDTSD